MNGTAINGERVVLVKINSGRVNLLTGSISTLTATGGAPDHPVETVVLEDRPARESREEICERAIRVDDIHLLKEQEARSLQDRTTAENWFGSIYQDRVVSNIHRALKRFTSR